ncbi:MAG: hypothetical protein ACK5ME_08750 [Parahaliea sp.]
MNSSSDSSGSQGDTSTSGGSRNGDLSRSGATADDIADDDSDSSESDSAGNDTTSTANTRGQEPGFGHQGAAGSQDLPDLIDEPVAANGQNGAADIEQILAEAAASGQNDNPGDNPAASGGPTTGDPTGQAGTTQTSAGQSGQMSSAGTDGSQSSLPGGIQGPLTSAEQVAILDGQLTRGAGEFDAMILAEQAAQRQAERERQASATADPANGTESAADGRGDNPYSSDIASGGDYSVGGGMGGPSRGGSSPPPDTAKYPPPKDIPSGDDDDVVARQLREAAMRETDPAVREKLWDEYRKYKGISQ